MKKMLKPTLIAAILISFSSLQLTAQIRDFGNFLTTGPEDAQDLFEAYITPYINGFGASLTGGWYNTAKPHKLGGFDLTISFNTAIVPDEERTFDVSSLEQELQGLRLAAGEPTTSPTVAGERDQGPQLEYAIGDYSAEAFNLPSGTGFKYVPSPMIQAGIGLFKGTEIMGRYFPTVTIKEHGQFGMWGVGLKHDIKQWIPGLSKVPVLQLSVMGGYTRLNAFIGLDVDPAALNLQNYVDPAMDPATWDDQRMALTMSSFTTNLLVSANLPVICFYGGVGIARTRSTLALEGRYPTIQGYNPNTEGPNVEASEEDPFKIDIKNSEGGLTTPRLNIGMRLKMAVLTIHVDYTRATYNVVSAGIGISFR